ncbi:MAG: glutathione ABC transporter substrate-binding protein [Trueperaceae bacterium]|nr:glutathione ABC transporter substrate-binding protein [Trueperaceae bacterium]
MSIRLKRVLVAVLAAALVGASAFAQTLVVAQGTDPVTLDPHNSTDSPTATVLSHIYETLFDLTADGEIVPNLATSAVMSDDGQSWTVTLRDDVTFHNGAPLTAEVVKYSMERFTSPANAYTFAFLLNTITSIDVIDDHTLVFNLNSTFAPFLAHLTHTSTAIVHPDVVPADRSAFDESNPVGTGPFRFASWQRGERIDLERNEAYWGEQPGVSGVAFLNVPEDTTRMAMVETGQAHVAVRVPPQDVARIDANPNVTVHNVSGLRTIYIFFNQVIAPFDDVRVRQAINYAVDKEEIVEFVMGGSARVSDAPVAPGIFGYTPVGPYDYDPERARQLLAEAGFADGLTIELWSPTGRYPQDIQVTQAIQGQLAEVGITAEITSIEWAAYLEATAQPRESARVGIGLLGWGTVTGDSDYGLYALFHSSQAPNPNRAFYNNPAVDALLDQARTSPDFGVRQALYAEAMQTIWDDAAWLFLYSESQVVAMRDEVNGFVIHPTERFLANRASLR